MSNKNYISNSFNIKHCAIQYSKQYRIKFIDGSIIDTLICDGIPEYYFGLHYAWVPIENINTPRSYKNIRKYSKKLKANDPNGKLYNTNHILSYELISKEIENILIVYEYDYKKWFMTFSEIEDYIISKQFLIDHNIHNLNKEDYMDINKPFYHIIKNHILK